MLNWKSLERKPSREQNVDSCRKTSFENPKQITYNITNIRYRGIRNTRHLDPEIVRFKRHAEGMHSSNINGWAALSNVPNGMFIR